MKVTKYPQSCLLLEKNGKKIVIDPGNFFAQKYSLEELGPIDAVLYTLRHKDHLDAGVFEQTKAAGISSYGNADVCTLLEKDIIEVKTGEVFFVGGFEIMPHDIDHFVSFPNITPPQNTGYIIDQTFFHPGDGHENNGVRIDNFAAPIAGPFGFDSVIAFIKSVGAKRVIPIHFTNQALYPAEPEAFLKLARNEAEIIFLDDGESAEL